MLFNAAAVSGGYGISVCIPNTAPPYLPAGGHDPWLESQPNGNRQKEQTGNRPFYSLLDSKQCT